MEFILAIPFVLFFLVLKFLKSVIEEVLTDKDNCTKKVKILRNGKVKSYFIPPEKTEEELVIYLNQYSKSKFELFNN